MSTEVSKFNEKYFRPSKYRALNVRDFNYEFFDKYSRENWNDIKLPNYLFISPANTILNYFSILREAEDISFGGCGSIGNAKSPYGISYNFFTFEYQSKNSFEKYMEMFKDIGHINLIKLSNLSDNLNEPYKYFIEIETIEPSIKEITSFSYYYGFMYVKNQKGDYKISDFDLRAEDFLCAPYHGWVHNAELYVDTTYGDWCGLVKKRHETVQICYVKNIYVTGTDGHEYKFQFYELTNGTDIEVNQFICENGRWIKINIDVYKCLKS